MTKREAAIVTAFTGRMLGDFSEFHGYAKELMQRPVFTHEFGSKKITKEIHDLAKADFIALEVV